MNSEVLFVCKPAASTWHKYRYEAAKRTCSDHPAFSFGLLGIARFVLKHITLSLRVDVESQLHLICKFSKRHTLEREKQVRQSIFNCHADYAGNQYECTGPPWQHDRHHMSHIHCKCWREAVHSTPKPSSSGHEFLVRGKIWWWCQGRRARAQRGGGYHHYPELLFSWWLTYRA